jgi:hypothetical protein
MRYSKWLGLLSVILLISCAFFPWVTIESKNLVITGLDTRGTNFGKPAMFHFVLAALFLICNFTNRIWAKRLNLLIAALNLGWALRNILILGGCMAGECPARQPAIWIMLIASVLMLLSAVFPDMKLTEKK